MTDGIQLLSSSDPIDARIPVVAWRRYCRHPHEMIDGPEYEDTFVGSVAGSLLKSRHRSCRVCLRHMARMNIQVNYAWSPEEIHER